MALDRKVYRGLEDIVGPENVSEEPAILDTYAFQNWSDAVLGDRWMDRPGAVLLPGSTEEVQAILKTCNRYGIKSKALSTGWIVSAGVLSEDVVQLDLRRMNRILELNVRDMYCVIEPYVSWAQLQAEAMKVGLNCNIIEAGSQTSPLASCTSGWGMGSKSISMGHNERNLLGVEWVLPTGEILRLGSVGSGVAWFCGDGPGPSLRGIMRGYLGAMGGLGVFTKIGMKLYHWPGPRGFFRVKGVSPTYEIEPPGTFRNYYVFFPTWEDFANGGYKLGEAEILSEMQKCSWSLAGTFVATSNEEFRRMRPILSALVRDWHGFQIVLEADSEREFEYKEKVLDKVLAETNGRKLPIIEHPDAQARMLSMTIRASTPSRAVYRPSGAFCSAFGGQDTFDLAVKEARVGEDLKKKYVDTGVILDDGYENGWGVIYEHTEFGHLEELIQYDPAEPESYMAANQCLLADSFEKVESEHLSTPFLPGDVLHQVFGKTVMNYAHWLRQIKRAFDPNTASESWSYISPEEPGE